jgi:flagellar hook protein FlgE
MAFQQGLSGLNISSKSLDVISNNIANASTIGFKAGQTQFADVFAASLGVAGASVVGTGASLAAVQQQFSQGNVSASNNPLDIAINGNGFFQLKPAIDSERNTYTRNGQFRVDSAGYIVNAQSSYLTGYQLDADGAKVSSAPIALSLDMSNIGGQPKATTSIQAALNLDDRDLKSLASASPDRKSTRLNSSHNSESRMPSSA